MSAQDTESYLIEMHGRGYELAALSVGPGSQIVVAVRYAVKEKGESETGGRP